jgi:hypothetical protein
MNWFAISRAAQPPFGTAGWGENRLRSSRHQLWTISRVSDFPAQLSQLISQLIGLGEVLGRPRLLAFLHQLSSFRAGLNTLIWLGEGAEADQLKHLRNNLSCLSPIDLGSVRFPD